MLSLCRSSLKKFIKNDKGDGVTQVVSIAAGVILILGLLMFGRQVFSFVGQKWEEITKTNVSVGQK
jgi:hypothetical protein